MKVLIGVLLIAAVAGCSQLAAKPTPGTAAASTAGAPVATTDPAPSDLTSFKAKVTADLTAAIADGSKATDAFAPVRVTCYNTILSLVPTIPDLALVTPGESAGIFDAFEHTAEVAESIETLAGGVSIPNEVRVKLAVGCGPVTARARDILLLFNLRLGKVAGAVVLLPK